MQMYIIIFKFYKLDENKIMFGFHIILSKKGWLLKANLATVISHNTL